jgi:energy-coupling factor transporter ATP-binding protein EcfA2
MTEEAAQTLAPETLSRAFEHSITWEHDIWRADPVDVVEVHGPARRKFGALLETVTSGHGADTQARVLLFLGQSGAGKTHLLRALRTAAHRQGKGYFGYAQMTPDVASYADYFLRRLVHSLEKPYHPDQEGESGLFRLAHGLVADADAAMTRDLESLREAPLDDDDLSRLVLRLADAIVASPRFAGRGLDINTVRALLYLQRRDPRIDHRIREYLNGRPLAPLAHQAVAALDPNIGEDRAFEVITALGRLMWAVDEAALVFCIDQVEDLRFFANAEERFQKAVRDLIQIANRLTNAIVIISCLEDFYGQARSVLAQSYIDRIEKAGPVALIESRTPEEARLIISRRLEHEADARNGGLGAPDPVALLGRDFFEEFAGLSTRRLLEHVQSRLRGTRHDSDEHEGRRQPWLSTLASALGGLFGMADPEPASRSASRIDYRDLWERFQSASEAIIPSDDRELLDVLAAALGLCREEWGGAVALGLERVELGEDLPALDVELRHSSGLASQSRVFLCNRSTQGGGLKRQLDKVQASMAGRTCFLVRATDFPSPKKNQTAQALRTIRDAGGRALIVPMAEWEQMIAVREFHAHHRTDPGFAQWFEASKLLSSLVAMVQLLRLDLFGCGLPPARSRGPLNGHREADRVLDAAPAPPVLWPEDPAAAAEVAAGAETTPEASAAETEELPVSLILDEDATGASSILAGREGNARGRPITLNTSVLKRHSAVLGGSGSGKTTLALCLIEQLLLRGIPAVLIDRKGDLCSYANPDVWRASDGDYAERRAEREKLADAIDVAVYTPGRASGRPISITLLPNGISELPGHEQQLLANLSSAALGDMLHLKNSATHQKQSGTLSVALRILGQRSAREVTLGDLIGLLEDEDPELTDLTQRMDPSGKIRRDLVAQLDSLRHRNSALFEGGGEPLRMESLLGLGRFARPGRTRLSIIYTGFLGDNENILFWVSQFLSEALRFCQRNPNDALQALVMFDEADLYIPANAKPATAEPLQSLLKRARSAGLGIMLATQSPGDLDYKSRDQITSWFIGRVREDTALRKLKAAFQSESGLDPAAVLPGQTVGEFHLVQEGLVRSLKAQRSLVAAEQVPFDRIEQLAQEAKGQDERQLRLFDRT